MPDLMNNTQQQNNSTSDGGTNRRASKLIESCFLLETTAAPFTISSENKFGAITDKYFRTTARLEFSGTRASKNLHRVSSNEVNPSLNHENIRWVRKKSNKTT